MKAFKNITALRNELLIREAGKRQVDAAQMGEVLARLSDLLLELKEPSEVYVLLYKNARRRAKRNGKL